MSFFVENILKKRPPMYSSLFSFGQFKLKYITRTPRYWYKSGIFQATNKTNLRKSGGGAPSPIFP